MPRSLRRVSGLILWMFLVGSVLVTHAIMLVTAANLTDNPAPTRVPTVTVMPTDALVISHADSELAVEQQFRDATPTAIGSSVLSEHSEPEGEIVTTAQSVYLPIIVVSSQLQRRFIHTGMHLGNRPGIGWDDREGPNPPEGIDFLERLRGNTPDGSWPAVVVVLSNQVFSYTRSQESPCNVTEVREIREHVFRFMAQATRVIGVETGESTVVLIRINPSPGNFVDADDPDLPHILSPDPVRAAGSGYCGDSNSIAARGRDVSDIMAEMNAIMEAIEQWNTDHPDARIKPENVFFIPANEPNIEWYTEDEEHPDFPDPLRRRTEPIVWEQMDTYFTALYDYPTRRPDVQILTPAMAPWARAEPLGANCENVDVGGQGSGYSLMPDTYDNKNDGYVWHNYWSIGKELWGDGDPCNAFMFNPDNHHMFQYFPGALQTSIRDSDKPRYIAEADIRLEGRSRESKDDDPSEIRDSLRQFIREEAGATRPEQEQGAQRIAIWLLTQDLLDGNEPPVTGATSCTDLDYDPANPFSEIPWHMAYLPDGTMCTWFDMTWR